LNSSRYSFVTAPRSAKFERPSAANSSSIHPAPAPRVRTARELEVAGSAALDRKRRYRILYVPYVFDPDRWRVLPLQNPAGERTRNRFRVIRTGSVRYGFDIK
jgi:hypothetical protein